MGADDDERLTLSSRIDAILIVDDDVVLCEMLAALLIRQGYRVLMAGTALEMAHIIERERISLIFLDIELPDGDGLALLRHLRRHNDLPVIMLTGQTGSSDRLLALELGADDYIAKPFDSRELLARLRNVLRRTTAPHAAASDTSAEENIWVFDRYELDPARRRLCRDGEDISLTGAEFDLMLALVEGRGRVLTRDMLLGDVRDRDWQPYDRSIDVLIGRLRAKIEPDRANPMLIKTIRGGGYMLAVPVHRLRRLMQPDQGRAENSLAIEVGRSVA